MVAMVGAKLQALRAFLVQIVLQAQPTGLECRGLCGYCSAARSMLRVLQHAQCSDGEAEVVQLSDTTRLLRR